MHKRYHSKLKRPMIIIQPGEYYVTKQDVVISTVLGSCISVCLKDEANGIGGMNHFMLPGNFQQSRMLESPSARYGMYAMELVIGDIIKMGGDRSNLTAKFFGGGHVLASLPATENAVPKANIAFINSFLTMEGIKVLKSDVGGNHGRKLLFLPASGKAYVKRLVPSSADDVAAIERRYKNSLKRESREEDLTLF
jgi:chemotaxis protein CheD